MSSGRERCLSVARGRPDRSGAAATVLDESRPIADVTRSIGVNAGTLGSWVGQERIERGDRDTLSVDEWSDLVELRAENTQLRMEGGPL